MHLLVTDRLGCPRCGPAFGLVLMADQLEERRVLEGRLGCPNCREHYPVTSGFGDFRPPPRGALGGTGPEGHDSSGADDPEGALRVAAFLGVTEGPGLLVLAGPSVRHASRLAAMIPEIEVAALSHRLFGVDEQAGVSRMAVGAVLPFRDRSVRGVVLEGAEVEAQVEEAVRVLGGGSRLVVQSGSPEVAAALESHPQLDVALATESVVVALRK